MNDIRALFDFIKKSTSAFLTVKTVKDELIENEYTELLEGEPFSLSEGGKYFITKNSSSLIAFRYKADARGFMLVASHSDSPSFRLKSSVERSNKYTVCDTEKYGGMLYYSWLDRPLSVSGRVLVRTEGGVEERLVDIDKDLFVIPSLAIHLNRSVNSELKLNPAVDLLPLSASGEKRGTLLTLIADAAGVTAERVISHDLFLYVREEGRVFGTDGEFISAPRIDDLASVYASTTAFLNATDSESIPVLAIFDNEEVGSETKQGALSSFLFDTISELGGKSYKKMLKNSLMVSADNAHAIHPNHPELSDPENAPLLNGGVVIKHNANQRYATDAPAEALFTEICNGAGVKLQSYYNRADIVGGSTLGSIATTKLPVTTIDIGLPQLAMHSAVETAGAHDTAEMVKALTAFYSSSIEKDRTAYKIIK